LRFAWRGDQLEFDLIDRIDSLYWQAGHYRKSLETLQQSARSFPETPAGEAYEARLQARFVELFGSDRILSMSPLAAISLYRDYAKLMPADEDGDRVLRGLAERLVEIDLLDQAGDILAELIQERLDGQQKARTGTRLAGIRLLSGQPEAAIEALDASREEARALPALTEERRLLRAHALAELGQAADALDLLAADHSPIAAAAKAEIAWRRQDWAVAVDALTELVEPPPPAGSPIVDAELVLNLGIALALANDAQGLRRLADRYGAAMALSPSANTFAILTRSPGGTPQIADLAAIRQQVSEVDLFQEFLRGYRTADGPGS
jgi:tetratricopeptide (TPR) repeat protein